MKSEAEPTKILKKKCPLCACDIISHVPDDEFLKVSIGIFKQIICATCGAFKKQVNTLEELKRESWTMVSRLNGKIQKLKAARLSGSKTPSLSMTIAKLEEELKVARADLQKINEKEQDVLNRRSLHEQQLKERSGI